jgi:type IV pilus assembly protein PilO
MDYHFENLPGSAQAVVFAVLAAGLVAVFYVFYLRGPLEEREHLRTELTQLEPDVAQGKSVESRLSRFKSDLARLDQRFEILRSILLPPEETAVVLRAVQQMATASSLKITRFTPQPFVPRGFYSDWPIIMEVEGNYHALGLFFEKVSRLPRIINITPMTIKGIDGSSDSLRTLSAVFTATTFVLKEVPPSTRPDLP